MPAPEARDEHPHSPDTEPWWNESWYFDGVNDDADLGVYARLARLPGRRTALYTASIVGPGRPSIMLVTEAPLPDAGDPAQAIDTDALRAEHQCVRPLERYRVTLSGTAQAHGDASAPLRGEPGEEIQVGFDLVWETDGVPYAWRRATRYEIPCRVTGKVRVGDNETAFAGPGQRDHSWGPRDWFAVDWMWSALHLEDGTRTHAVALPSRPGRGVGYVQQDGRLVEIERAEASDEVAENGLITRSELRTAPPELTLEIDPIAFGAILLRAPDGRVSHFPRAMCRVRAGDGRRGTGWAEWNRNQTSHGTARTVSNSARSP